MARFTTFMTFHFFIMWKNQKQNNSQENNEIKVVSLFSWCWWLDLWFIKAWYTVIWANDFFKEAVETYRNNIWNHIVFWDITKIDSSEIPNDFDILLWWFPCQWFSVANNKRSMEDKRNFLYKEMLRIVKDKRPPFFLAENVEWLLSMQKWAVIKMIISDFEALWYKVDYKVLNSADYWVPQQRRRVIILWNRVWEENEFPKPTHKKYVTVKDVCWDLADVYTRDLPFELNWKTIYNHIARTNVHDQFWWRKYDVNQHDICDYLKYWRNKSWQTTKKVDDHFWYKYTAWHRFRKDNNSWSIPKPDDRWELKKILWFDDKYDKQVTELVLKDIQFEQSLRINNWETASDTITASWPEIHPNKKRRMSVRECARIQTFPDDFIFSWSIWNMHKQIWNAVPVLMAEHIAETVKKHILTYKSK